MSFKTISYNETPSAFTWKVEWDGLADFTPLIEDHPIWNVSIELAHQPQGAMDLILGVDVKGTHKIGPHPAVDTDPGQQASFRMNELDILTISSTSIDRGMKLVPHAPHQDVYELFTLYGSNVCKITFQGTHYVPVPDTGKLVTDPGTTIPDEPIHPTNPDDPYLKRIRDDQAKKFGQTDSKTELTGYRFNDPERSNTSANCHGTTFDRGGSEITEKNAVIILSENYAKLDRTDGHRKQRVAVCDIVVWYPDHPRHSACVVEVDADGNPLFVIGKDSSQGELWVHPPDNDGTDWEAYTRAHADNLPPDVQADVRSLRDEWQQKADDYKRDPSDAKRRAMHRAAFALCQRKNGLTHH